ncbi:uncharacterized protein LOC125036390 [Penaeus chinensis]|uniref:uncharacterized protein LOC125036390 n=1 Tax=Penaeus chinensis TaxID=139456 RepID=UPI001FB64436|nr:uncharacterized protein LOC125036390 [Penaeus chinensis]
MVEQRYVRKIHRKAQRLINIEPITCLPLMWKLLTGTVADEMYQYLEQSNILPDEQKGCRRRSRGTKDQLLIDRTILRDYDLKLYAKTEDQMSVLVRTVHMFSNDIGMEFGMKKCGVLTLKRGKIVRSEGIKLADGQTMKEVQEEGYTYLGIVELDKIKEAEMKDTIGKEYKRRLRLALRSKLNGKNKVSAINTWAVAIFRYGSGIIQWRENELKDLNRQTRKTITMYGAFHPKSDVDRLYVKRRDGGRGLISIERCVKDEESTLKVYVSKSQEKLLKGVAKFEELDARELEEVRDLKTRN